MEGMIFDIIRNSFSDGPGIRTSVFFKGCNLKCLWCHNPESQSKEREMMLFADKCILCGKCADICPNTLEKCVLCGSCELICPNDARRICGRMMTDEEIISEVMKDKSFYDISNGGVTFSGGECMLQLDFLIALLIKCKKNGINSAIDTAGNVPYADFQRVMPYTDIFLYDVKCASNELHKKLTGVSNDTVLQNLKRLSNDFSGDIIIRIPLIKGVNDTDEELKRMSEMLKKIKYTSIELLPYHKMGEHKYSALGREVHTFSIPDEDDISRCKAILKTK